jgi:hypothetical protein
MSPVAAAFASPCSAFGGDCAVVVVDAGVGGAAAVVGGAAVFEAPQAATSGQSASRIKRRFTIST